MANSIIKKLSLASITGIQTLDVKLITAVAGTTAVDIPSSRRFVMIGTRSGANANNIFVLGNSTGSGGLTMKQFSVEGTISLSAAINKVNISVSEGGSYAILLILF